MMSNLAQGGGKLYDNIWLSSSLSTGLRSSTARVEAPAMVQVGRCSAPGVLKYIPCFLICKNLSSFLESNRRIATLIWFHCYIDLMQEIIDMGGSQHAYFHAYSDHKLLWVDIDLAQCHEEPVSQDSLAQSMSPLLLWAKSQITP